MRVAVFEPRVESQSDLADIFLFQLQSILVPDDEFDRAYSIGEGEVCWKIKDSFFRWIDGVGGTLEDRGVMAVVE